MITGTGRGFPRPVPLSAVSAPENIDEVTESNSDVALSYPRANHNPWCRRFKSFI
jgi:hypothetical protein